MSQIVTDIPRHFRLYTAAAALAALVIAATVLLAAGPTQASAATLDPDGGNLSLLPQDSDAGDEETPELPEHCPGGTDNPNAEAASVVFSGDIALFDVSWDDEENNLKINPCPPTVEHEEKLDDDGEPTGEYTYTRTASDIIIGEDNTVIHIPNTARVNLNESDTYTRTNYRHVWHADSLENRRGAGVGDGLVWVLPACSEGLLADGELCLGFSAEQLNPDDWGIKGDGEAAHGEIEYLITHSHSHDTGEQGGRYVLSYHAPEADADGPYRPIWDTSNTAAANVMRVSPGANERPMWFFTRAGRYEFQVHVTGYPEKDRTGREPISQADSVTSATREFFLHVGLLADLSVEVTAGAADPDDSTIDPGDEVTITVTASNAGPDEATKTKVEVTLPEGLVYSETEAVATAGTYDSSTSPGVWTVGNLAVGASETLTITATVAVGTRGQEQTVAARIYAAEHLGAVDLPEPDPDRENNTAKATITPAASGRTHAQPIGCPGDDDNPNTEAASVVSSGDIALFDVFWSDEEELANNPCPPVVEHHEETSDAGATYTYTRTASDINIGETVIHIPTTDRINLNDTANSDIRTQYPDVVEADNRENRDTDGDGHGDQVGDGLVWMLPACPVGALTNELCIGFSAELLEPKDWGILKDDAAAYGKVQFKIPHLHLLDVQEQDDRYLLAYHAPGAGDSGPYTPGWNTLDPADKNVIQVSPGQYERSVWFFTRAGRYELEAYVEGYPEKDREGWTPVSGDDSVTSDFRQYIFHVGPMADLGVTLEASTLTPQVDTDFELTVTASNAGPDEATNTEVHVTLPEGLAYSSHSPVAADYDPDTAVWSVGTLAAPESADSPATATLTITVRAGSDTADQSLKAEATIQALESLGSALVQELDPNEANNHGEVKVAPVATPTNAEPQFLAELSVVENSQGVHIGGVPVLPGDADPLTYSLTGEGADNFTVSAVDGGARIAVATDANLDYEAVSSYTLTLGVSDGRDAYGNADDSIDGEIAVRVNITDDPHEQFEHPTVTLTADLTTRTLGQTVTLTAEVSNSPVAASEMTYHIHEVNVRVDDTDEVTRTVTSLTNTVTYSKIPVNRAYTFRVTYSLPGEEQSTTIESNVVAITWIE